MANDRIYMQCRYCYKTVLLTKYFPSPGEGVWDPTKVSDFIERHISCSPHFGSVTLEGDRCFDLFTESSKEFEERMAWADEEKPCEKVED